MSSGKQKPKGYALHVGLNEYAKEPYEEEYDSLPDPLKLCVDDANALAEITKSQGFDEVVILTNQEATRDAFTSELARIIKKLKPSDIFVLSYSGHGGRAYDVLEKNEGPAHNGKDEFWCFHDDILIDDILYRHLCHIPKGVRVFILSDSCHGGGMYRAEKDGEIHIFTLPAEKFTFANRFEKRNYVGKEPATEILASVIFFGAVRSQYIANEGEFTQKAIRLWYENQNNLSYKSFHKKLKKVCHPEFQPSTPVLFNAETFVTEIPFSITNHN